MRRRLPKHLSYDYQLKLEEVPTKHADRMPLKVVMPGIILGLLMAVLGCFELTGGMYDPEGLGYTLDADTRAPLFSHTAVDAAFIIIGLGIVIGSIVSYVRYKKIFFNGIRLRMEFFQFGILNKNKYIVELVHRDPEKTIPLYISTDGTGIYQIWYYYAKRLNMPTVIDTDEGTVKREVPELDKSLKEYLFAKGLIAVYEEAPKTPADIVCIKKADRTVIRPKRMFWDIFSLLGAFWLCFYLLVLAAAAFNYSRVERMIGSPAQTAVIFAAAFLLAVLFIGLMFKKDKIVLKDGRLILVHKFLFISNKEYADLSRIRDIQIAETPVDERITAPEPEALYETVKQKIAEFGLPASTRIIKKEYAAAAYFGCQMPRFVYNFSNKRKLKTKVEK